MSAFVRCDGCGEEKGPLAVGWVNGSLRWTTRPTPGTFVEHNPSVDFCSFVCMETYARLRQAGPKQ